MKGALYARYSTDQQSGASVEDQFRECERIAQAAGVSATRRFADRGISGGTAGRPGYQELLEYARTGAIDAIIAEDISRLWRNLSEQSARLAELSDLGVHVITHDIDTRQESAEILGAVQGAMNSLYRKEISRRTRRGLEGCALAGKSTGGKTFGYGPGEADVVRRIFTDAARGVSQANIALQLTYEGIPAPRGGAWRQSTVAYILKNVRYSGQVEWGRTICRRSAVDSRRQRVIRRSGGPLVSRFDESLRIVA